MKYSLLHDTAVTKQWTAKYPYIANAVFRIVHSHGEKSYFRRFLESPPLDPPLSQGFQRQLLGITQKWLSIVGQENGYFCWSDYAIFQGINTV